MPVRKNADMLDSLAGIATSAFSFNETFCFQNDRKKEFGTWKLAEAYYGFPRVGRDYKWWVAQGGQHKQ
ncbi:MAG: hypothetical protein WCH39_12405 [Schlesneria sp.]